MDILIDPYRYKKGATVLVSNIYPINYVDDFTVYGIPPTQGWDMFFDDFAVGGFITSGTLRTALQTYDEWPIEDFTVDGFITSGTLRVALKTYNEWPIEDFTVDGFITSGTLRVALITYSNYAVEDFEVAGFITGGTLT